MSRLHLQCTPNLWEGLSSPDCRDRDAPATSDSVLRISRRGFLAPTVGTGMPLLHLTVYSESVGGAS
jgi:hypothetical protein